MTAPSWVDKARLCEEICVSDTTVDNWVAKRILPPGRPRGGKTMWKWSEVDKWLTDGPPKGIAGDKGEEIYDGTRRELQGTSH